MSVKRLDFEPAMDPVPPHKHPPWPPIDYGYAINVSTGNHTWRTIADAIGMDVRTLIYFNFKTTNPREINFFLFNHLGCWRSRDRKNFDFEDAFNGTIYVPKNRALDDLDALREEMADILLRTQSGFPALVWLERGLSVAPHDISQVGQKLRQRKIVVLRASAFLNANSAEAMYKRTSTFTDRRLRAELTLLGAEAVIFVKDSFRAANLRDQYMFVHECTHAISHVKYTAILEIEDEILCRCASELWLMNRAGAAYDKLSIPQFLRPEPQKALAKHLSDSSAKPKVIDLFDREIDGRNVVTDLKAALKALYRSAHDPDGPLRDPRTRHVILAQIALLTKIAG